MNAALPDDCPLSLCSAAVEIDPLPPERLLALAADPVAAFITPGGEAWVGLGAVRWFEPGPGEAASPWAGLVDQSPDAPPPAALGALPFNADETPDALWQGLAPGGLVLPARLYVQREGRAWWRLTLPQHEAAALAARLAQERRMLATLARAEAEPLPPLHALGEGGAPMHYEQAVTQAVARIRRGELVKVVLARRAAVAFDSAPAPAAVLAHMGARHADCVRYAWRRGGKTWLGATPETLVRLDGRTVRTEALAGTRSSGAAAELLTSAKERHEHATVVGALRRTLAPLARALPLPCEPVIRALHGLAHLHTPIEAELRDGIDFMQLVRALHPTPAVCGMPTRQAAALLAELEAEPRGLYAGPFVRLSADGDGHAVVALRGAVLSGRMAVVTAGAGIVEGSVGAAELAETRVKQAAVVDALRAAVEPVAVRDGCGG
jgi:isochorismate synthase